jgi:hypothetical protein
MGHAEWSTPLVRQPGHTTVPIAIGTGLPALIEILYKNTFIQMYKEVNSESKGPTKSPQSPD